VFVHTLEPGMAGMALKESERCVSSTNGKHDFNYVYHDATGLGERSTSTRHIRQLPAIASLMMSGQGKAHKEEGYGTSEPVMVTETAREKVRDRVDSVSKYMHTEE
jgi:hypothetical protein